MPTMKEVFTLDSALGFELTMPGVESDVRFHVWHKKLSEFFRKTQSGYVNGGEQSASGLGATFEVTHAHVFGSVDPEAVNELVFEIEKLNPPDGSTLEIKNKSHKTVKTFQLGRSAGQIH